MVKYPHDPPPFLINHVSIRLDAVVLFLGENSMLTTTIISTSSGIMMKDIEYCSGYSSVEFNVNSESLIDNHAA